MEFRIADTFTDSLTQLTGEEQLRAAQRLSLHRGVSAVVPEGSEKISVAESFPTRREQKVTGADVLVGNFIRSALTFERAQARKTHTF